MRTDASPLSVLQTIDSLPPELLVSVLICGCTYDLGRLSCTCRNFQTLVGVALRQRAGLCSESDPLPEGEVSWTQLLCWRERRRPRCGNVLAAGRMHSAFADAEGRLLTCGTDGDGHGFLGHGDEVVGGSITTPLPLESLGWPLVRVVAVAAHTMHSLALSADGTVFAFGQGRCGKLGHGGEATEWRPRRVVALEHEHVVGVAAGQQHSLVLTREGGVYSFGSGFAGKLGHGDRVKQLLPRLVEALRGVEVAAVAAGSNHSLVVADGSAYSFGDGVMGQLGHGDRHEHLVPKRIAALERVQSAVGGENHSIALDDSGASSLSLLQPHPRCIHPSVYRLQPYVSRLQLSSPQAAALRLQAATLCLQARFSPSARARTAGSARATTCDTARAAKLAHSTMCMCMCMCMRMCR